MIDDNGVHFLDVTGIQSANDSYGLLDPEFFTILKTLSPVQIRILNASSHAIRVSGNVEMLHEGDAAYDLYFVRSGKLAIIKEVNQQRKALAHLYPGDIYGEFGALRKKVRYASVVTTERSEVIRIEQEAVSQILEVNPTFHKALNHVLKRRILDSFFFSHTALNKLPPEARIDLSEKLNPTFIQRGHSVFSQGDKSQGPFLILSGNVDIRYENKEKEETLLEIRRNGDVIGEVAHKAGNRLAYTAIANTDVDVLLLTKNTMRLLLNYHKPSFLAMEQYINKRAAVTVSRMKEQLS
ncbi:MAG: cyclic nucleotide-binding domain-containing protein [Mariprofundaceae bacterium]|nr:cyclic nucleotide-binding domain-containing protein [Mariprofundaceae bacterium]